VDLLTSAVPARTLGRLGSTAGWPPPGRVHVCLFLLHSVGLDHSAFERPSTRNEAGWLAYPNYDPSPGLSLSKPLFPAGSFIHDFFPARVWAIRLPAIVLILGLGVVGSFVGLVMQKEAAKKREKEARKGA
jgi:dolichyl-phosphate mannosyltransferase polypeptide 2 regulatory subunit